jgi:hypothetical protein
MLSMARKIAVITNRHNQHRFTTAKVKLGRATMPQWEYDKIDLNDLLRKRSDVDALNDAGDDGWGLVNITANAIAYLKRPIGPEPKPPKGKAPKA